MKAARKWAIGGAALVVVALVAIAILQSRPVRDRLLAEVIARLGQAGYVVRVDDIGYRLLALSADLSGVSIATATAPSKPFFAAKAIHVSLPWRSLFGSFVFDRVDLTSPQIALIRDAEGHTNWPASSAKPPDAKPMRISIGQARVTDLVFAWSDEQTSSHAEATVSLDLTTDKGELSGPLTMSKPASIRWRDRHTTITALDGRVGWNERDLSIKSISLRAPEGTLRADGRLEALLEDDRRVDVRVVSDANLGELSKWIASGRSIAGAAHADVRLAGPIANPAIELTSVNANVADGSIAASGKVAIDGPGEVRATWKQLDLPFLVNSALGSAVGYVPADRISGSLNAQWKAPQLEHVQLTADASATDAAGSAAGSATAALKDRQYSLSAKDVAALGARVTGAVRGELNASDLAQSPMNGTVDLEARDASGVVRELVRARLIGEAPPVRGNIAGSFAVGGTFASPSLHGSLNGALQYASTPETKFTTRASITASEIGLADIDARLAESAVRGAVQLKVASGEIGGALTGSARLKDLAAIADALPPAIPLDGALDLSATLSGSLERPRVAVRTTGNGLDIAGQRIDRLTAEARVAGPEVSIDRLAVESGPGRIDANGTINLNRDTYTASLKATDVPVRPIEGVSEGEALAVSGVLNGTFDGQGSFSRPGGRGHLSLTDARWQDADLGRISGDVTLAGRDASFTLDAADLALTGNGSVGLDPNGAVTLRGRWTPDDVAAVARRLGISIPLSNPGTAVVGFDVNGTRDRIAEARGHLTVEKLDVAIADQPIRLVRPGRIDSDGRTIRVDDIVVATGSSNLTVAGSLGESAAGPLTLTLDGSLADFWFIRDLVPQPAEGASSALAGSVRARVTAEGALAQPKIAGSFQITGGRLPVNDRASVTDVEVTAAYDGGVLTVSRATAAFEGATLAATARVPSGVYRDQIPESIRHLVPATSGPATLSAQLRSITPSIAAPFVSPETLKQLALQADASLNLESDRLALDGVRGTVALDRAELSLAGVPFDQQGTTRLRIAGGRATVDTWDWGRGDNRVTLRGSAPLDANGTLDLVANATLDLRLLNVLTPDARILGRAYSEIRLGGTAQSPAANGYLTISEGEARVAEPRLIVGDLAGTITFAGDTFTLQQLSATVNGGDALISGSIRHQLLTPVDGTITFRTTSSSLDLAGLRAEADAALDWRFEPTGPTLGGTVTLQRSAYRETLSLTGGLLKALQASARPVAQPAAPSLLDRTRLDVRVVTGDDLIVDNNLARLTARADLRVVGTPARPSVTGRATLGEGGALFFSGNRYRLSEGGSIDFANPNRIEPDLDVTAVTRVQGNEITLSLKGTPDTLETSLSSDNANLTQSDLVSLLVIGRTADASSANATQGAELVGLLTGDLLGAAGRAVGLDTVRVERGSPDVQFDAGLVATETNPGARLTFGKHIGSQWEVVFSQSLQQSGGTTWIVSYAPRSNIGLRVVSLDDGDRQYDFTHNLTFGGPKRGAAAVKSAPAPRITEVSVTGAGADEAALRDRMKLQAGDRFSFFEWQDDRERVERFYHEKERFEARVTARRVVDPADASHVRLTYDVRPGPRTSVAVDGFKLSPSTVDAIELAWTRAVVDEFLGEEVVRLARVELASKGFLLPTVTARVDKSADAEQLRVTIDPGAHAGSRRVEFSGNAHESSARLLAAMKERGVEQAIWTEPERAQDALEAFYRANGYLDASVRAGTIAVANDTATRPVQIEEGDAFRVGQIHVEGVRALTAEEAVRLTGLTTGETFTEARIEKGQLALDQQYRARGFNRVVIDQQVARTSAGASVDVAMRVEEGPQQRLRDVVTTGLDRTRPSLVSRALKLEVGQPVDLAAWNAARRRLYQTGAFRSVDIQREVIEEPPANPADAAGAAEEPVRAKVTVQEWPPLRLRYGVQVLDSLDAAGDVARSNSLGGSSDEGRTFGIGLTGDLGARNLFGRAISAGVAGRYAPDTRAVRVYGTSPSFFGRQITTNVFVERSLSQQGATPDGQAAFETRATTTTFEQRIRPAARTEVSYSYSFERNYTFLTDQDPNDPLTFEPVVTSALSSSILFDRRNDLTDPSQGWFHSSSVEYSPPALKASVRYVRYFVQQRYYRRLRSAVFATSTQVGMATAFDQTLIPAKRFFAGGGNSVRGYDSDVLSPFDNFGNAVGGDALLVLNEELRFPIFKWVRGVTFFDAGRAFDEVGHMSLRDLSASTGFGLRVQTPFVLLRVDYGVPFDRALGPRRGTVFFSIGQMF